jgi:rRNA maturation protein Nop10
MVFRSEPAADLDRCPDCGSDLVYPIDWSETPEGTYTLRMRCPNCEWTEVSTHDWETVQRLEQRLEACERAMMDDLQALTDAIAAEHAQRFIAALRADQVWPMDF